MNENGPSPQAPDSETPRRRRRHGYRGYPLRDASGVHFGTGFSGVQPPGGGSGTLPKAGVLTESTKRGASE